MFSESLNVVFPNKAMRIFRTCQQKEWRTVHVRRKASCRAPEDTQRERGDGRTGRSGAPSCRAPSAGLSGPHPVRQRAPGSGFGNRRARGVQDSVIEAFLVRPLDIGTFRIRASSIGAFRVRVSAIWGVPGAGFGHRRAPGSDFGRRRNPGLAFGHLGPIFTPEWTKAEPGIPRRPKREPAFLRTARTHGPMPSQTTNGA